MTEAHTHDMYPHCCWERNPDALAAMQSSILHDMWDDWEYPFWRVAVATCNAGALGAVESGRACAWWSGRRVGWVILPDMRCHHCAIVIADGILPKFWIQEFDANGKTVDIRFWTEIRCMRDDRIVGSWTVCQSCAAEV